jgi:hypothetical protein
MAASHPSYSEESCAPPSKLGGGGSFVIVSSANHALHRVNSAGANVHAKIVPNGIGSGSIFRHARGENLPFDVLPKICAAPFESRARLKSRERLPESGQGVLPSSIRVPGTTIWGEGGVRGLGGKANRRARLCWCSSRSCGSGTRASKTLVGKRPHPLPHRPATLNGDVGL